MSPSISQLDGEWEEVENTVDSGASMSMALAWFCADYPWQPTRESASKIMYKAANGTDIAEAGKRTPMFHLESRSRERIEFRVGPVHKTLLSTKYAYKVAEMYWMMTAATFSTR